MLASKLPLTSRLVPLAPISQPLPQSSSTLPSQSSSMPSQVASGGPCEGTTTQLVAMPPLPEGGAATVETLTSSSLKEPVWMSCRLPSAPATSVNSSESTCCCVLK